MATKAIQEVLEEQTAEWMAIPGVLGTAIGEFKGRPCIKVFLAKKTDDLEFVDLPSARFRDAHLVNAWLTGSVMIGADFRSARLNYAGLADIDWEQADLRGADLRGCSFHLGSSRSGLVGSPYPGHGSRTGFYTNDYDEQTYKAPETIRKANLCGCVLRAGTQFTPAALGLFPYVEIGFMPLALTTHPDNYTPPKVTSGRPRGGALYPPRDYAKWEQFIETWAKHCAHRYGQKEAASWYWELWNEPDIAYYSAWQKMGSPQSPTPKQYESLEQASKLQLLEPNRQVAVRNASALLRFALPRQSVSLIRLTW